MSKNGDEIMQAQRRYENKSKNRTAEIRCILCGMWPSKGHTKLCPEHPDNKRIIER